MNQQAAEMKLAWDNRAAEDARWYINPVRRQQTEAEFDASGRHEVQCQIVDGLALLTGGRDPRQLRLLKIGCALPLHGSPRPSLVSRCVSVTLWQLHRE